MLKKGFSERDWLLFRNKIVIWQEAYMDKLKKEYTDLVNTNDNPSAIFWSLDKRIKVDEINIGVIISVKDRSS